MSQCLPIVAIKKRDISFEKIVATLKSVIAHVDLKIGKNNEIKHKSDKK